VSNWFAFIGSGATITWDKEQYGIGEEAAATVVMTDGYYDLTKYTYHVKVLDLYGTEVTDLPIVISTGSPHTGVVHYTWEDTDDPGIYYAAIYAKQKSDNQDLMMNYDMTELTDQVFISGFVKDAPSAAGLSGATVFVDQVGGINTSVVSGADGNYSITYGLSVDSYTMFGANKTNYDNYSTSFTPTSGGTIQINISLMPIDPPHTGVAVGGLVMKPPYNQTVDNARVDVYNATVGTRYTLTTNGAGYYVQNDMPNNDIWDIWGSKSGFSNSTIYKKLVWGV
jgi:hypothetical protein